MILTFVPMPTPEQIMKALAALKAGEPVIAYAALPGAWHCRVPHAEIKHRSVLTGLSAYGANPEHAVRVLWEVITALPDDSYIVIYAAGGPQRRAVRWNGFMWEPVIELGLTTTEN